MTEERHIIWDNYDLDYEDWRADLEEEYPELPEDERIYLMHEINGEYLDDERTNLNIQLNQPILVIADLGLWHGRRMGYKEIESGNIRDCLYSERDIDYSTWYVDKLGDLRCDAVHHDGTNHMLYRTYKDGVRASQIDLLKEKIYYGKANRADITRVTRRLGDEIGKVYGWDFPQRGRITMLER
ncbi:MAG: hypothetical protein HFF09_07935 [Oscillospiraceae bacterium]|nr:hypothetical protein [Oscillospiraceae bacterium]